MKRYFVFKDDNTSKFWYVDRNSSIITIGYGKLGYAGISSSKLMADEEEAIATEKRMIKEKLKLGFKEISEEVAGKFGEVEFWNMIERAKAQGEDIFSRVLILEDLLSERIVDDIVDYEKIFQKHFANAYIQSIWDAASIINGSCTEESFEAFRAWLILQGKDTYFNTLSNPEYLSKVIKVEDAGEIECEEMLYVAANAFSTVSGKSADKFLDLFPEGWRISPPMDWDESDDDELKAKYPGLWKKYAGN